jgi:hypothetical protein
MRILLLVWIIGVSSQNCTTEFNISSMIGQIQVLVSETPFSCSGSVITDCPNEIFTVAEQTATMVNASLVETVSETYATGYVFLDFYVQSTSKILVQTTTFVEMFISDTQIISLNAIETNFLSVLDIESLATTYELCVVNYISGLNFISASNERYPALELAITTKINREKLKFRGVVQKYKGQGNEIIQSIYSIMPAVYRGVFNIRCDPVTSDTLTVNTSSIDGMFNLFSTVDVNALRPVFNGDDFSSYVTVRFVMPEMGVKLHGHIRIRSCLVACRNIINRAFTLNVGTPPPLPTVHVTFLLTGPLINGNIHFTSVHYASIAINGLDINSAFLSDPICIVMEARKSFDKFVREVITQVLSSIEFPLLRNSLTNVIINPLPLIVPFTPI